jgi:hypothetical protein
MDKNVNIPVASSVKGLKEDLEVIAKNRGVNVSKIVSQIYTYAVNNKNKFPNELESRMESPGKHISSTVSEATAAKLTEWAKELGRTRVAHCCFLLEVVIAHKSIRNEIFNH